MLCRAQNRDAPVTFLVVSAQMEENARQFDYDWLVVGSGFGGSRLGAAAGREGLLGRRARVRQALRATRTSPSRPGDLRRYFWTPRLGMRGIFRLTLFKDVSVVSRLRRRRRQPRLRQHALRAARAVLRGPAVGASSRDWEAELAPHYDEAQRMLGVVEYHDTTTPPTSCCASTARRSASATPTSKTPVGVFFGEPGQDRPRPLLRRRGARPHRLHAVRPLHGRLPHGAKNTLVKNYLWFAEKLRRRGDRPSAR